MPLWGVALLVAGAVVATAVAGYILVCYIFYKEETEG